MIRYSIVDVGRQTSPANGRGGSIAWQYDRTITHAFEARHTNALRLEQPPHFAITSLHQRHVIPMVVATAAVSRDVGEARDLIVEEHAVAQNARSRVVVDAVADAHRVLAVEIARRMHQSVHQCAIVR